MVDRVTHKSTGKTLTIVGLVVIILLLWFWFRNRGPQNTVNNIMKAGDIDVQGPHFTDYNVPGLKTAGDVWDWIHACDLGCECGPTVKKAVIQPSTFDPLSLPIFIFINPPRTDLAPSIGGYQPAPSFNFPSYAAPPLPEWWYDAGYNVHHEAANYVTVASGMIGILGKYSRSGWPDGRSFPQQTKDVVINGEDLFMNGKHYKHNPAKDNTKRPPRPVDNSSAGTAFTRG